MSNKAKKVNNPATLDRHIQAVREEVVRIGRQLAEAEGESKLALEAELTELMSKLGMIYEPSSLEALMATLEAEKPASIEGLVDDSIESTDNTNNTGEEAPASNTGWWDNFKAFVVSNKKKLIGAALAAAAAAAAAYAYLRRQATGTTAPANLAATPAFHHAAEAATDLGVDGTTDSFMTKAGAFFSNAYAAVKEGAVNAKNWVVGLFHSGAEAVDAAA